jgi:putative ABC transport system permease protein
MNITLTLAWRNLWRHRRRTWLTTAAMVFSNVILVFMISMQLGTYDMMVENTLRVFTGHIQLQAPAYNDDPKFRYVVDDILPLSAALREDIGSDQVAARALGFALASSEQRSHAIQLVGVEPAYEPRVSTLPGQMLSGRYLEGLDAAEIVVGSVLARNLKVGLGDEVTLLGSGLDGSFAAGIATVVGIFESGMPDLDRSMAQLPLVYFQDLFSMRGEGHSVVIETAHLDQVDPLVSQLREHLRERDDLVVLDWDALQPGLRQAIQADMSSAMFMYLVLVVLVAFSVLNTQLMSVLERTREFGIMMALGLKPLRLGRLVMLETALMASLGLLLGVVIGGAITSWVGHVGITFPGMDEMAGQFNMAGRIYFQPSWVSVLSGPLVVFLGSLTAAIIPAMRLRAMQPVAAMRAV